MPSAKPCFDLGKKYEVLGMKPENTPPPIPERKARINSATYGVDGERTANDQPTRGKIRSAVE